MKKLVEEYERKYRKETKELRQQELEKKEKKFSQELPRKSMVKLLYRQRQKRYEKEMGQKLESMEKFLGMRKLKRKAML